MGRHIGDGKSDGETFLGRTWMFFLGGGGGGGGGKRKCQGMVSRVGRWTTCVFKQPHFVIYYMLRSGGFTAAYLQTIVKGVLDPRLPWATHVHCSVFDNPSTCSTHEDSEGADAPRSATDSTDQWV